VAHICNPTHSEDGGRRILVWGWLWAKSKGSYLKNKLKPKGLAAGGAQVAEFLKHEALNSNPSTTKKTNQTNNLISFPTLWCLISVAHWINPTRKQLESSWDLPGQSFLDTGQGREWKHIDLEEHSGSNQQRNLDHLFSFSPTPTYMLGPIVFPKYYFICISKIIKLVGQGGTHL
jgi:hypothetical protein